MRVASSNLVIRSSVSLRTGVIRTAPQGAVHLFGLRAAETESRPRWIGREARQRPAKPYTRVRIPYPPRSFGERDAPQEQWAIGAAVARFPDTEEVTGSIPVSPTIRTPRLRPGVLLVASSAACAESRLLAAEAAASSHPVTLSLGSVRSTRPTRCLSPDRRGYSRRVNDPILLDESTTLRLLVSEDGPALASAYRRNCRHLAPWEPLRSARFFESGGQTAAIADALVAYRVGSLLPLVLERESVLVGRVTLANVVHGGFDSADLGYWLDGELQGRGLMTHAVGETLRLARDEMRLHRVQAGTLSHNVGSQTVLRRNGFERIGIARRYLRIAGQWQDHTLFQALLEDGQLQPPSAPII